ncbi:RNA polymerase sigma factor [Mucilaginibacter sp. FT3.2]|uniref:RNA polymerase sigma factor n=1 Tax=Mucilaginibacter sp. FT3.2 TaxID=2723090 RepID=UPI00161A5424|nr:RNA polymerase sigma-70 factor [Mucilaginibacter sp. FT3.2]MBB6230365.1 RNA polymerase sigma-70 factor (ECF subfamily) [Mucilaginibacter sp. FT3.2]
MNIQELVHLIQFNDDELAFNELYRQQVNKLYQFAYSFLGDKEPAEEIVNDIFLKIWLNRSGLDGIRNVRVYMYVTVKNACLNYIRGTSSKQLKELNIAESYYFHLSVDPAQLLISKQLQADILIAIDGLPPRCKLIFKMVKQDGLSCKEVAAILNLSDKTVFAQLAIALKKLESIIQ